MVVLFDSIKLPILCYRVQRTDSGIDDRQYNQEVSNCVASQHAPGLRRILGGCAMESKKHSESAYTRFHKQTRSIETNAA